MSIEKVNDLVIRGRAKLVPAAVQEENEQLRLAMDEIARITREITE